MYTIRYCPKAFETRVDLEAFYLVEDSFSQQPQNQVYCAWQAEHGKPGQQEHFTNPSARHAMAETDSGWTEGFRLRSLSQALDAFLCANVT